MRSAATSLWRCLCGAVLLACLAASPAFAKQVKDLRVDAGPTGTRAEIQLDGPVEYSLLTLAGPDRLVVDLPGVALPGHLPLPSGKGLVRSVRTGHPVPGTTRVVFDLAAPVAVLRPRLEPMVDGQRLVLEWPGDGPAIAQPATPSSAQPAAPPASPPPSSDEAAIAAAILNGAGAIASAPAPATADAPGRPLLIAIDAGHGGQDPGAIGKGGRREKDVTLAISRELARQVNATPGLEAYLVRDGDVFIPLYKRARLAREAGADIFVSIHADAAENRSADGSSVYVLSLKGASSQRARWLADKENAADLLGGIKLPEASGTLNAVLLDLTQSGNMRASEDAAAQVLAGLQRVGNIHKRTVERANFAVLRTADMPSMLVETAFISNPEEERRLGDPAFQRKLATAVLDGINTYFERQPPPGTLYAQRAARSRGGAAIGIGASAGSH